jgi:hypothetical protein
MAGIMCWEIRAMAKDQTAVDKERIVAIGLLSDVHLRMLGSSLKQVFLISEDDQFDALIRALDEMEATRGSGSTH